MGLCRANAVEGTVTRTDRHTHIHSHAHTIPQAAASPAMIAAARAECERARVSCEAETLVDAASLVAACSPALSCLDVAIDFCRTVSDLCHPRHSGINRQNCGAAGAIPAVAAAMSTHGAVSGELAQAGCVALNSLAWSNKNNADEIVMTHGGLDAILSVMASHPGDAGVQRQACSALIFLCANGSPAAKRVMRTSAAVKLLTAAKVNHPSDRDVKGNADGALAALKS